MEGGFVPEPTLYFLSPPLNETYPKYCKALEDVDKERRPISLHFQAFKESRSFANPNPLPPSLSDAPLAETQVKTELKRANRRVLQLILKNFDTPCDLSAKTDSKFHTNKLLEEVDRFLARCTTAKITETRQTVCELLREETKALEEHTLLMKESLKQIKERAAAVVLEESSPLLGPMDIEDQSEFVHQFSNEEPNEDSERSSLFFL